MNRISTRSRNSIANSLDVFPLRPKSSAPPDCLSGIPVDPAGFPYVFGPDGKSKLDPQVRYLSRSPFLPRIFELAASKPFIFISQSRRVRIRSVC